MAKLSRSRTEKKRAPKPQPKDVHVTGRQKPGTKPGTGPYHPHHLHSSCVCHFTDDCMQASRHCQTFRFPAVGTTGWHGGPIVPPNRPLVHEGPPAEYARPHLGHAPRSYSHSPPALVKRHQPQHAQERPLPARHSDGLAGPSSVPRNTYLGHRFAEERPQPRPIVDILGGVVSPISSRHPPGVEQVHNHSNNTDKAGAAQATQLLPGCKSLWPCTQTTHGHIGYAHSRPTTFTPGTQHFQAGASNNLPNWRAPFGADPPSVQGRWPRLSIERRYPQSGSEDKLSFQQVSADFKVRSAPWMEQDASQVLPVAPDTAAGNGHHDRRFKLDNPVDSPPAQAFWCQGSMGKCLSGLRGPWTKPADTTIPYNKTGTYQVCPTRKPVAIVDEASVMNSDVSPREYWLWLVGGTSGGCVEQRRE
ncbi:hypothetical protein C2E23DRAFT_830141 [Lenzites betulinus]|nr:hypothetical protein C2E23DRAFT_830141 [Lenzites betulinus]